MALSPEAVLTDDGTEVAWDKAVIWSDGFNHEEMLHEPEVSWQKRSRVPDSRFGTPLSENQLKL